LNTQEYIEILKTCEGELKQMYGIRSLVIFGSVSRGEQKEESDVDIFVDMAPNLYRLANLKRFLENKLKTKVDVVRKHSHINPYLFSEIERDGINVF